MGRSNRHLRFEDERDAAPDAALDALPDTDPSQQTATALMPLILVGVSGVLFAFQGAVLKLVYARNVEAFQAATFRGSVQVVGVLATMLAMRIRGDKRAISNAFGTDSAQRGWLLLRAVVGYGGIGFGFACFERLPLGDGSALQFVSPVVSVLVAWRFLGERLQRSQVLGIFGTAVGVVLVARPPSLGFDAATHGRADALGVALALLGALSAGCAIVIIRKLAKMHLHWTVILLWQGMGQVVLSPGVALVLHRSWIPLDATCFAYMLAGGVAAFFAQMAMTKGLAKEKVGPVSAMRTTNVLFAYLFQHIVTPGETIYGLSVLGALCITGSIVLILVQKAKDGKGHDGPPRAKAVEISRASEHAPHEAGLPPPPQAIESGGAAEGDVEGAEERTDKPDAHQAHGPR